MQADSLFRIGSTHRVCQDYAVSGTHNGAPYAMVSDGCSSSPDTDFGARFLVKAAQRHLTSIASGQFNSHMIVSDASAMARQADLNRHAIDATLLCVTLDGDVARVNQTGDGVVAARRRDGSFIYYQTEFDQGAPYYLSYLLNDADFAKYKSLVSWRKTTTREWEPSKGWLDPETKTEELFPRWDFSARVADCDVVLLLSDGCQSFFTGAALVPLESVLEQIFALKNLNGEFLTRRCNAFLQRFCKERGWQHADDFSVAGIYLGEAQ